MLHPHPPRLSLFTPYLRRQKRLRAIKLRINLLQAQPLRFPDQEITNHRYAQIRRAPEEERAVFQICHHVGVGEGVDEAEEPLRGHADGDPGLAEAGREDFGYVGPLGGLVVR